MADNSDDGSVLVLVLIVKIGSLCALLDAATEDVYESHHTLFGDSVSWTCAKAHLGAARLSPSDCALNADFAAERQAKRRTIESL